MLLRLESDASIESIKLTIRREEIDKIPAYWIGRYCKEYAHDCDGNRVSKVDMFVLLNDHALMFLPNGKDPLISLMHRLKVSADACFVMKSAVCERTKENDIWFNELTPEEQCDP